MPKSKDQKRKEAIERARVVWPQRLKEWLYVRNNIESDRLRFGNHEAERRLTQARNAFTAACQRAMVDTHGNPL